MFPTLVCFLALVANLISAAPSHLGKRAPAQIFTKCTVPNTVALTFDDGPYIYLYDVGKAVEAAGGKATFFFNGDNWGCIYAEDEAKRVKWAFDRGHQVASHTWSHSNLTTMTWDQLHNQLWLMEDALSKITGATPAFMRPPYGAYNDLVREVSGMRGQSIALWDFDSGDTWGIPTTASNQRYTDLANQRPTNVIALNHDVHQQTAQVIVPHAINVLKVKGYRFVTLAECLGMPAYQRIEAPKARDASWTCTGKL